MPENTLETKARRAIAQYNMLPPGALVLAALSGGADSVALTHFLCREGAGKFTLLVAHVNHGLRGGESDRDEEFAREFCAKSGLELFVKRVNVRREMQNGESEEVCGRRIRYAFFQEVLEQAWEPDQARELGQARRPPPARCIATAHTQNDSAETVLLNLVRGSGGAGLRGIPAVRGKNSELADEYENSQLSTVNLNSAEFIIRPLIHVSREDVVDYCVRHGISYVTDSSNHSDKYARNRVRTLVIPGLVTVNPAAVQTITRTAEFIARDEEYLSAQSAGEAEKIRRRHPFLGETYPVAGLLALPSPIRRRVLVAAALGASGHLPEAVHIKCMERLLENGGQTSLPGGF
ncbi:MAG: tRNA lysidine(34) synthetase TilS [Oscillospiraceae bacterium]|jgi:tRNA(Ile)-lysidine synthase|nr:tRNA lysidine(34) synthetase TilS [Oscillospiraceae bacterium]